MAALTGFAKRESGASHPPPSQNAPAVPRMDTPVPSAWRIFPFLVHLAASSSFLDKQDALRVPCHLLGAPTGTLIWLLGGLYLPTIQRAGNP